MKTLYLVRHAKAVSRDPSVPDFERLLSKHERQEAKNTAWHAQTHYPVPDILLTSPARRALETTRNFSLLYGDIASPIALRDELYDEAQVGDATLVFRMIQSLDNVHLTVMLVGHNPLCWAVARLFDTTFDGAMPTGAIACVMFNLDDFLFRWASSR